MRCGGCGRATLRVGGYGSRLLGARRGPTGGMPGLATSWADVNAQASNGPTQLMFAGAACSVDAVRVLVDRGADVNAKESVRGLTPLMFAAASDRAAVIEKFGVGPEKLGDVLALMGDKVDNIPGIPGIGPKTAAQLINDFGNLEAVLAGTGQVAKPKLKQSLIDHADEARMSRQLVELQGADRVFPLPARTVDVPEPAEDQERCTFENEESEVSGLSPGKGRQFLKRLYRVRS